MTMKTEVQSPFLILMTTLKVGGGVVGKIGCRFFYITMLFGFYEMVGLFCEPSIGALGTKGL